MIRLQPISTLFPYTTLFRSKRWQDRQSRFFRCLSLEDRHADIAPGHRQNLHRANFSQSIRPALLSRQGKEGTDRKSTRLNSSHTVISYAVFCLKKKNKKLQK